MASKCLSEKKSHTSLTSNQKLEMTKLSEEGISNVEIGWKKAKPLAPKIQGMNTKEKFLRKLEVLLQQTHEW